MSTHSAEVLRLPEAAVPEGCRSWDAEQAGRWTRGLPPRWVPVRARTSVFVALPVVALAGAGLLHLSAGLPAWAAALVALNVVWLVLRPEAALVLVPFAAAVVLTPGDFAWPVRLGLLTALVGVWAAVGLRLAARKRQRAAGLDAAGGVTAEVPRAPGAAGGRAERGTFLLWSGLVTVVAGGSLYATAGLWDLAEDRQAVPAAGWCLAGLGLTVLLSSALARRRAVGLRWAPVPVLRVLVRENGDVETEVFAADDLAALRPLFTVSTVELAGRAEGDDDDDDDDENEDNADDESLRELISRIDDERAGPLREAVLYGAPYDGAEVVFLAAADKAGEPPVVEASVGPVRPVTGVAFRWRARTEKGKALREARQEALRGAAAAVVAERIGQEAAAVGVRRWRAGWADWFAVGLVLLFVSLYWEDSGWWRYGYALVATLLAALLLPRRIAWRVTADREGLWFNGLGGTRHLAWDHVRAVECEGVRLRIHGRQASFEEWRVASPRWPWLESRFGLVHPYERTAAEITAMWRDPAARPADLADERQRGRALWPLGLVIGIVGTATVALLP
ncbi:hypothetical protein G9272_28285 [Streptomyces asoensis]|uniref:PH domain-containing protein n=1 Tax=Streptomyces asoensis TaxID=249586 RepID=A0A6M4X0A9_9ACTN|nr:hypothetical protein [Streptomyces asoensis]QJT03696.1 hypothetical protein G9272_28285 [Streptomyces asoensis]